MIYADAFMTIYKIRLFWRLPIFIFRGNDFYSGRISISNRGIENGKGTTYKLSGHENTGNFVVFLPDQSTFKLQYFSRS